MTDTTSTSRRLNSENGSTATSDVSDSTASLSRSLSPNCGWIIKYKILPKKNAESKGVWDGYETKEEFMTMHLR
ncbi:unnamed protein product [Adineta ricciae]|uniref:Uncharacterized protein n=1 Tax=Adineta ricciae TaxID=249248 RepID=A0A816CES7_ADIRI|nr:unnamed protein product [Adineta ricciae]CAF1621263.1 unnamed protein product [Adineta ricciae]